MRLAVSIAAGVCTTVGLALGWPWGAVAVAGCVVLSLAGVHLLARAAGLCWRSAPGREPLRVVSMRLAPGAKELPGTAGDAITEGKSPWQVES